MDSKERLKLNLESDEPRQLKLVAPEGWRYVGWNRVILVGVDNGEQYNISTWRTLVLRRGSDDLDDIIMAGTDLLGNACLFHIGAESFNLEDLAVSLSQILGIEVICENGKSQNPETN